MFLEEDDFYEERSESEAFSKILSKDAVFLFASLSDGKSIESVPIENIQGLRGQISRFSWQY